MKTKLPVSITTVAEAKAFLFELNSNNEAFHPEDDATLIDWSTPKDDHPDLIQAGHLNYLMGDIYNLAGNDGRHVEPMIFDPCQYLVDLCAYQAYLWDNNLDDDSKGLSYEDLRSFVADHIEQDEDAEQGDEWVSQVEEAYEAFTHRTENGFLALDVLIADLHAIKQGVYPATFKNSTK